MFDLSSWVLGISGICLISVLVEVVLPEGGICGHIKKTVSYSIILVVVYPIPKFLSGNLSFDNLLQDVSIPIQEQYIYNINQAKLDELTKSINKELQNSGIYGADTSISADIFQNEIEIFAVYVDLYNMVIKDKNWNKDIKTEVVSVVLKVVDIPKEKVIVYE